VGILAAIQPRVKLEVVLHRLIHLSTCRSEATGSPRRRRKPEDGSQPLSDRLRASERLLGGGEALRNPCVRHTWTRQIRFSPPRPYISLGRFSTVGPGIVGHGKRRPVLHPLRSVGRVGVFPCRRCVRPPRRLIELPFSTVNARRAFTDGMDVAARLAVGACVANRGDACVFGRASRCLSSRHEHENGDC